MGTTTPGTQLKILDDPALLIEECVGFTFAETTRGSAEFTPISNVGRKKVKVGRGVLGKMPGECAFDPTDPSQLRILELYNAAIADAVADWELALVDSGEAVFTWSAFVESFSLSFANSPDPVKLTFSLAPTTLPAKAVSATEVTPSETVNACIGEGTVLALWVTSAYVALVGVENIELSGGSRDTTQLPGLNQTAPVGHIPGNRGILTLSFDLLYDSSQTNHETIRTSLNSTLASQKFKITCTDSGAATIELTPAYVTGWAPSPIPGANRTRVTVICDTDITVVP